MALCGFVLRKLDNAAFGVFVNSRVPLSEEKGLPTPAPQATRWEGRRSVSEGEPGRAGGQGGRSRLKEGKNIPALERGLTCRVGNHSDVCTQDPSHSAACEVWRGWEEVGETLHADGTEPPSPAPPLGPRSFIETKLVLILFLSFFTLY